MKKHLFLKSLLIAIGLLVTSLTTQAWATTYAIAGTMNGWSTTDNSRTGTGAISITFSSTGNYTFKIVIDGSTWCGNSGTMTRDNCTSWGFTNGGGDDCTITVDKTGTYTFNIDNGTPTLSVTYPAATYAVAGDANMNSWSTTANAFSSNKTSFDLESGNDYEFKIVRQESEKWYGNSGTMTSANCTNWDFSSATDDNATITANITGTYVFELVNTTPRITVHYPVAISYNKGTNGTGTISGGVKTWGANYTLSSSTFTRSGYTQDGWATSDGGDKAYNLGGTYSTHTAQTFYPHWTENMSSVSLVASPTEKGSFTIGGVAATSTSAGVTTTKAVTAVPIDGYHFVSWAITGGASISGTTDNPVTVTGGGAGTSATLTATFAADDVYTLTVAAGTGISSVSGTTNNIKAGDDIAIAATVATGYTWSTWTKTGTGTLSTYTAGTKNQTVTVGTAGDMTLTASATENTVTLSPTCGYDHGNPGYSNPTASNSGTVGIVSTSELVAPDAGEGYEFAGWTLSSNLVVTSGDEDTDQTITVSTNGDGNAVSARANYNEVLDSRWHLVGLNESGYEIFPDGWSVSSTSMMEKISGHAEDDTVAMDITVTYADRTYLFKVVDDNGVSSDLWYGYSNGDTYLEWTATSEKTVYEANDGGSGNNSNNLKFTPTVAGTYKFQVDYSGSNPKVKITYPTSYTLTYGFGTIPGNDGDITTSPSTASGSKVLSGSTVTLTAPDAKAGYYWQGWFNKRTPSADDISTGTNRYSTSQEYEHTMSADTAIYACYGQTPYTVTIANDGNGTTSPASSVTARAYTVSEDITATPSTGYMFSSWTLPDGVTAADGYSATSNPIKINATAASKTITANFAPRFVVTGSDEFGSWNLTSNEMTHFYENEEENYADVDITNLLPNKDYTFKIYDKKESKYYGGTSSTKTVDYEHSNTYVAVEQPGNDFELHTAGVGTYNIAFNIDDYDLAKVYIPTSWYIVMKPRTFYVGDATGTLDDATGGSISAEDGEDTPNEITDGSFVKNEGTVVFTADPEDGYTFAGWYSNEACTTPYESGTYVAIDNEAKTLTLSSIGENKNVYAKFTENSSTITVKANNTAYGSVKKGPSGSESALAWDGTISVGVHTTMRLHVTPAPGYYFAGWTKEGGANYTMTGVAEADSIATVTGAATSETKTLTANFQPLDTIYFKNTLSWAKVFVYFNPSWDYAEDPSYSKGVYPIGAEYTEMTNIGDNIYRALIPRSFTRNNYTKVAFSDVDMHTYGECFYQNNAVYRDDWDYNTKTLDMYIPCVNTNDGATHRGTNKLVFNSTTYYNHGYWVKKDVKINDGMGYYIKNSSSLDLQFTAIADDEHTGKVTVRVDNLSNQTYYICSAGGREYSNTGITFTSGGGDNQTLYIYNSRGYFTVTPSAEGDYTFYLYQDGDHMSINVSYPVSPGDYRIRHSYTDGGTKYSYTDIIKKGTTSDKVSMYIRNTLGTLKIAKCSGLGEDKKPEWTTGFDVTGYIAANFPSAGVYVFDVAIVDDELENPEEEVTSATISNVAPYTGDFYIKTDCAPGGWANYTQNVMDKNTINASDFDHYFCKNVGAGTNVKFVIANDYNIQVTDTIIQDLTYLTTSGGGTSKEYMPEASCIRFSYNSATNEAKRAYLRYSNNNNFLNIIPSAANTVYAAAEGATELYGDGSASATNKFGDDDGNFVYRKTVYAVSGASIDVKAEYTNSSKKQTFVTGHQPITSSSASARYPIQVVYDFKTNNLTTAWHPGTSAITEDISDVDYMYIRDGQAAADQLTFSGGKLTDAKVCGAFQFKYDDYVGRVGAWPQYGTEAAGYTYSKCMFYFSFPFNVKVSDIFGIGTYGKEWKIQYYDGAERAKKGFFRGDGTTTFWKDMQLGDTLKAYIGYSLLLDNDYFNTTASGMVFNGKSAGSSVFLYFPSYQTMSSITSATKTITIPSHECTLTNSWTEGDKTLYHSNTDSHWNMLGVPLLNSQTGSFTSYFTQSDMKYLYEWDPATNTLNPAVAGSSAGQIGNFTFKAMGAYMVQFAGNITFTGAVAAPSSVAARQKKETKNYTVDLEVLDAEDTRINHTYVELRDGASDDFMLNEDMYMTLNSKAVNIYSFAGDYDVAANVLSLGNHVVPVGVAVKKAGTYKFSMPYEFSGTVTLVDKFNNTRTNLAFDEYEVYLEKGSINDRFDMEINIHKVPTSIENVDGNNALNDGGVHKFIENDQMYILKNGTIYNAQGAKVK